MDWKSLVRQEKAFTWAHGVGGWWVRSLASVFVTVGAFGAFSASGSAKQLGYHGGPVLTHPTTTYILYWQGQSVALPAAYLPALGTFIDDWSGSQPRGVLTQYFQRSRGKELVSNSIAYGGLLTDNTPFPRATVTQGEVAGEVEHFVHSHSLAEGYRVNYAVVLPQREGADDGQGDCAWHNWVADAKRQGKIFYSVIPYYSATGGCGVPGPRYPNGADVDNAIDRLSHELSEIATNPWYSHSAPGSPRSWYVDAKRLRDQAEIGDLCRFKYGPRSPSTGADVILDGHPYLIQEEWSNENHSCSLGTETADCGRVWGGTSNDPFTFYSLHVKTVGTRCSVARAVASGWGKATSFDGGAPLNVRINGFDCTRSSYTQVRPLTRCRSGASVVLIFKAPQVPAIVDYTGYVNFAIKPKTITQGASNELHGLRWISWGSASSTAVGRATANGSAGYSRDYPAKVNAYAVGRCEGLRVYTRLSIRNLQTRQAVTETLHCQSGSYF